LWNFANHLFLGTQWQIISNIANDPLNLEDDGFKFVSVNNVVMAISNSGFLCKRHGITIDNPCGTGWELGINGNWSHICVNSF
jgi:tectonin beta-propeller repeat-containing protein 1